MICKYCGKEISEDDSFCPICGASLSGMVDNTVSADNSADPAPKSEQNTVTLEDKSKPKSKIRMIIACLLAMTATATIGFFAYTAIFVEGREEVVKNYVEALESADYEGIKSRLVYDIDELGNDLYFDNEIVGEEISEYFKEELGIEDGNMGALYDEFSPFYEAEVEGLQEMEDSDLEEYIEEYKDSFAETGIDLEHYIEFDKITDAYEAEVSVKGTYGDDYEEKIQLVVVKYDGKWKMLDFLALGVDL